jgi:hypothetical protein
VTLPRLEFPGGKRFAFTIFDDTDVATLENVRPVYRLLEDLGFRTTKTVWPHSWSGGRSDFSSSETLENPDYCEFVVDLHRRGFEIASHGASFETSLRDRTLEAMERFRTLFGSYPRLHANHAHNRENVYWGTARLDNRVLREIYRRTDDYADSANYSGHVTGSPYWWGDFVEQHIEYVRNLTFARINLLRVNPSMPYHDPLRPLVRWWFSACDAEGAEEFAELLREEQQEQLEGERGVCIVSTHLGKGYVTDGEVHAPTRRALESLAKRPGWFPTVGELLDWLRAMRRDRGLPAREWGHMQWHWAGDLAARRLRRRWQRLTG